MNSNTAGRAGLDKLPPHSIQAEEGVLGCVLLSPQDCIAECLEKLKKGYEVFYDLRHQALYLTLQEMHAAGQNIDVITLQQKLKDKKLLDNVGGIAHLSSLPDKVPSAANLEYYIDIVLEKYVLREIIKTCTSVAVQAQEHDGNVKEFLSEFERESMSIRAAIDSSRGVCDLMALHQDLVDKYERALQGEISGILSGFSDIDEKAGGFQPQEMIVIAGMPSSGKTSLALSMARNMIHAGTTVGILSLETSAGMVLHRIYSAEASVNGASFLKGKASEREMQKMMTATARIMAIRDRLLIDDSGGVTPEEMRAKVRKMVQMGAKIAVLDYMQLMMAKGNNETEQVSAISKATKAAAKENNIPIIIISSLNRKAAEGDGKPKMSHLRNSGQIEFDGNKIILLSSEDSEAPTRRVVADIAKNKDGETGTVDLTFLAPMFRFENAAPRGMDEE